MFNLIFIIVCSKEIGTILSDAEQENKNPIHVDSGHIGIEKWCIKHLYLYAYKRLMKVLSSEVESSDYSEVMKLSRCGQYNCNFVKCHVSEFFLLFSCVAIFCSDCTTAWNVRKQHLQHCNDQGTLKNELHLTKLAIKRHPKSTESFAHRRWLLRKIFRTDLVLPSIMFRLKPSCVKCAKPKLGVSLPDIKTEYTESQWSILEAELLTCNLAAEWHVSNYSAWSHRSWVITSLVLPYLLQTRSMKGTHIIIHELDTVLNWVELNVSDHSGMSHCKEVLCMLTITSLYFDKQLCLCQNSILNRQEPYAEFALSIVLQKWLEVIQRCNDLLQLYNGCHEALWMFKYELIVCFHKMFKDMQCISDVIPTDIAKLLTLPACREFCNKLLETTSSTHVKHCTEHHIGLVEKFLHSLE